MFAHIQTNDYIFETIHSNLEKLPWQRFIPTPVDFDLIMKVIVLFSNFIYHKNNNKLFYLRYDIFIGYGPISTPISVFFSKYHFGSTMAICSQS